MPARRQPLNPNLNPHFFMRDDDGSVRLRIRFSPEEADLIEEAAGDTPLLVYINRVLMDAANRHARKARREIQERLREDT